MNRLLVIDDDPLIVTLVADAFAPPQFEVEAATTAVEGLERFRGRRPDVVLLDVRLPDRSGLELFPDLRAVDATVPVIFITALGDSDPAIEAIKQGCFDYLFKPLDLKGLDVLVSRALHVRRQMSVPVALDARPEPPPDRADAMIGRCPAMLEVYKAIGRVAPHDVTVLIRGESGTGKELVARALYQHSRRAGRAFLALNCGAIPETLLESELFGHEQGAFTGAERRRIGKFEQCAGGTLFLDEIGEMPPGLQGKILRVLQDRTFQRVGGNEVLTAEVRLIAATHRDLEAEVAAGRFLDAMYYRLNVVTIELPPLRARGDDLPLLVDHALRMACGQFGRPMLRVAPETRERLICYRWPGNIRELINVSQSAVLRAVGPTLLPDDLPRPIRQARPVAASELTWEQLVEQDLGAGRTGLYARALERMERTLLVRVLGHTDGNQSRAAEMLGITRGSLRFKLRSLGLRHGAGDESESGGGSETHGG
jgi:two-component system nitrogen regulation response regulator GlnG